MVIDPVVTSTIEGGIRWWTVQYADGKGYVEADANWDAPSPGTHESDLDVIGPGDEYLIARRWSSRWRT